MGIASAGDLMSFDITDDRLFGNDAGDDEDLRILNYYFYERAEFQRFYATENALRIVKARKGTGKSALLRRIESKARDRNPNDLFVVCKGNEIAPNFADQHNSANPALAWQRAICARINRELGAKIKVAMGDDSIALVEAAELDSFRGRNILSALSDRLIKKLPVAGVELERSRVPIGDEIQMLKRVAASEDNNVWLIVDDIDATFKNTDASRTNIAAFFSACRDLVQKVKGLVIRVSVRTDVWTLLRGTDEALDKCDQYMFNLRWNVDEVAYILVSKMDAYFQFVNKGVISNPASNVEARKVQAFLKVFTQKFPWGKDASIDSQKYLALYSQGRPRWTANLCRAAAIKADARGHQKIDEMDVKSVLGSYSAQRRLDLAGEHSSEYRDFNGLLQIFSGWKKKFSTTELLSRISNEHIKKATASEGETRLQDAVQLAHLLFRAGALAAIKKNASYRNQHLDYEDKPTLLTSRAALDEGFDWEIPMYLRPAFKMF